MVYRCCWLLVALTAALAGTGRADVLFVDDDAPPGGDGLAWDTAYPWLRDALAHAAASGGEVTEIRVAQGTYRPDPVTSEPRPTCCVVHDNPGCDVPACEETVCFSYSFCCDTTWDAACVALAELFCGDLCEEEPEPPPTFHLVDGVALRGGYAGLGAPDPDARDIDAFPSILSGDIDGDDDLYPTGCCTPHDTPGCDDPSPDEDCAAVVCAELPSCCETSWDLLCASLARVFCDIDTDCPELADNVFLVRASEADMTVVLDGFTVIGGRIGVFLENPGTATVERCAFIGNASGMFAPHGATVADCTFSGNMAGLSAGGDSTVTDCVFTENASYGAAGMGLDDGVVVGCVFTGNRAFMNGGGMVAHGTVIGCVFRNNESMFQGGGLKGGYAIGCTFENNTAMYGGGASGGGFINCVFVGNSTEYGGALGNYSSPGPFLVNCTLTNNTATQGGALWVDGWASVTSSVLWGNEPEEVAGDGVPAWVTVMFSDVQGGFPGPGNIDADPLFVDPANGDYRLAPGSPCIDTGQSRMIIVYSPPFDLLCDVLDLDEDGDTIELLPVDFDGRSRFADDPDTPDTGCAAGPVVDMGAWEFGAAPDGPRVLYADLTGDGVVTVWDFLIALAQWGPCDDPCCLADVGLVDPPYDPCRMFQPPDGTVDALDMFTILGFWGF